MSNTKWKNIQDNPPPKNTVVNTCIIDEDGQRNECRLRLIGKLWFLHDASMYVYYTPTHWY
jgi:hypothetical protein